MTEAARAVTTAASCLSVAVFADPFWAACLASFAALLPPFFASTTTMLFVGI
jgi:hypothetical protein